MKSGKSFFQFPFVKRSDYNWLLARYNEQRKTLNECIKNVQLLKEELADLNLKRNAKGQFERRAKV